MNRGQPIATVADLVVGQIFTFGPSASLRIAKRAVGQILGVEDDPAIVHVRLFERTGDELRVFIGHLPIAFVALQGSSARVLAVGAAPQDWEETRQNWSERRQRGEVAAFDMRLAEIVERALEAVTDSVDAVAPESVTLRWVFPKRGASGGFNIIEAAIVSASGPDAVIEEAAR